MQRGKPLACRAACFFPARGRSGDAANVLYFSLLFIIQFIKKMCEAGTLCKRNEKADYYIRIADTCIHIEHRHPLVRLICRDYIVDKAPAFLTVLLTEDEIKDALQTYETVQTLGEAENLLVFLTILRSAYRFQAVPLHAAVIEYEGRGYAFSAASGTGKSTHIRLWNEVFGDGVHVINGDKPLLKAVQDETGVCRIRAYGMPWCGKEGQQVNASVPLAGLCFLERGTENAIRTCSEDEAVAHFFENIPAPSCDAEAAFYLQFADTVLSHLPVYLLQCTQSREAALTAYRGMTHQPFQK